MLTGIYVATRGNLIRRSVKITELEAALMSCPLPEPLVMPFWGGERTIIKRDALVGLHIAEDGMSKTNVVFVLPAGFQSHRPAG